MPGWAEALDTAATSSLPSPLGYRFVDAGLLELALTHRSWCAEHGDPHSNERLEFLGDAVLGLVVADHLFDRFPTMPEGELAKVRASVVNAGVLADLATGLDLGSAVRLGKGEDASGGRSKSSILADAMEAVIGAVYVDGGLEPAREMILGLLSPRMEIAAQEPGNQDFKTLLQELAARELEALPAYEVREEGPDHEKRFFAVVRLDGEVKGEGEGRSKKQAEQEAARSAWSVLVEELGSLETERGGLHA